MFSRTLAVSKFSCFTYYLFRFSFYKPLNIWNNCFILLPPEFLSGSRYLSLCKCQLNWQSSLSSCKVGKCGKCYFSGQLTIQRPLHQLRHQMSEALRHHAIINQLLQLTCKQHQRHVKNFSDGKLVIDVQLGHQARGTYATSDAGKKKLQHLLDVPAQYHLPPAPSTLCLLSLNGNSVCRLCLEFTI